MPQKRQLIIYLTISSIIYTVAVLIAVAIDLSLFSNSLGAIALICYTLTLIPGIAKAILPQFSRHKWTILLLKHRRFIGVLSFCFALNHGTLQVIKRNLNLLDPLTYVNYFQGFSLIAIFLLLTVTSSHEAVKYLKKKWQKVHRITHAIPFLCIWHIWDKMAGHWSYLTRPTLLLSTFLAFLFCWRQYRYWQLKTACK